ncbi:MAG: hypothetical protein F4X31_05605 [Gammaproteobacteria bacterium]|nr:hypothetical protein [Gammaproteobacteria bacterium]
MVSNNNVLSQGYDADVVKHPDVPDRDLFVFNTETDALEQVVSGVGTLLYGLAVDSDHRVFIAHTPATTPTAVPAHASTDWRNSTTALG